jgi:DNA-binding beta-propeller fold protein YncE
LHTSRLIGRVAAVVPVAGLLLLALPAATALAAVRPAGVIKVGTGPEAVAVDTENGTAWVANNEGENVTEIAGGKVRTTIPLGSIEPLDIAVDSRHGTVWVADGESGSVTEISARTGHVLRTIMLAQTDPAVNSIAVDPVHGEVFVTEINLGNLVEFSESHPASQHVTAGGSNPLAVTADTADSTAWVSDEGGTVTEAAYTSTQLKVTHTLHLSGGAGAIAADSGTGLIFVAEYSARSVAIVSAATRQVHTVKVGDEPGSLAADPVHGDVWVSNAGSDSLSQIRESTRKVVGTYPLSFSPGKLAVQPNTGVYVTNFLDNSVTLLAAALRLSAPRSVSLRAGHRGTVLVSATGFPAASVTLSGKLPAGLRWSASGPHGRISGTPARGSAGTYDLTLRATTNWGRSVSKRLTIKVS